jgi:hypothetical protein
MRAIAASLMLGAALGAGGCAVGGAVGAMAQEYEYQKRIEVPAQYDLKNKSVAVVVHADLATLYEFPSLTADIGGIVASLIAEHVPGARVLAPQFVSVWQQRTPNSQAMPYGEIAAQLGVDRVVLIDVYEYRHNPPGNRWQWEGVCASHVGIIERDGLDPDVFADTFNVISEFPNAPLLTRQEASEEQIRLGLMVQYTRQVSWLFYDHLEPKYPDKYRPEAEPKKKS